MFFMRYILFNNMRVHYMLFLFPWKTSRKYSITIGFYYSPSGGNKLDTNGTYSGARCVKVVAKVPVYSVGKYWEKWSINKNWKCTFTINNIGIIFHSKYRSEFTIFTYTMGNTIVFLLFCEILQVGNYYLIKNDCCILYILR